MKEQPKSYSDEFKRQVLEDYFRSGKTKAACCRQWGIPWTTFQKWVDACINEKKNVSLQQNLTLVKGTFGRVHTAEAQRLQDILDHA